MKARIFRILSGIVGLFFIFGGISELLGPSVSDSPDIFLMLLAFVIGGVLLKYSLTGKSTLANRKINHGPEK